MKVEDFTVAQCKLIACDFFNDYLGLQYSHGELLFPDERTPEEWTKVLIEWLESREILAK